VSSIEGDLRDRWESGAPIILDGATGTELERRGLSCRVPLWSAEALLEAPGEVAAIHRAYAAAGAEILTANTFRTQERTLRRGGYPARARELTTQAVGLCRAAAGTAWVAGSISPLEDCYRPERVPPNTDLEREHCVHATNLVEAGCDLLLVETQNTLREAEIALRCARATGLPVWVSLLCGPEALLLSGERLVDALRVLAPLGANAVGVNCLSLSAVRAALPVLARSTLPFGVYPNLAFETPQPDTPFFETTDSAEIPPDRFLAEAREWVRAGARFVGGCCGTSPEHIAALARFWRG